jgi:hypothetical protein
MEKKLRHQHKEIFNIKEFRETFTRDKQRKSINQSQKEEEKSKELS